MCDATKQPHQKLVVWKEEGERKGRKHNTRKEKKGNEERRNRRKIPGIPNKLSNLSCHLSKRLRYLTKITKEIYYTMPNLDLRVFI